MLVAFAGTGRRLRGVLTLDARAYEDVEADRSALAPAALIVLLGSASAGVGAAVAMGGAAFAPVAGIALLAWLLWALLVYVVGVHLLPEPQTQSDPAEIARVLGFASAPNLLAGAAFIPLLGPLVQMVLAVWLMTTMIVGVRQALDYRSTARAVSVVLIGWVVYVGVLLVL